MRAVRLSSGRHQMRAVRLSSGRYMRCSKLRTTSHALRLPAQRYPPDRLSDTVPGRRCDSRKAAELNRSVAGGTVGRAMWVGRRQLGCQQTCRQAGGQVRIGNDRLCIPKGQAWH